MVAAAEEGGTSAGGRKKARLTLPLPPPLPPPVGRQDGRRRRSELEEEDGSPSYRSPSGSDGDGVEAEVVEEEEEEESASYQERSGSDGDGDGDGAAAAWEEEEVEEEEDESGGVHGGSSEQTPSTRAVEEEASASYQERSGSDGDGGAVVAAEEEEEEESGGVHGGSSTTSTRAVVTTVNDADALECGFCCLPLSPPIFQCEVGHVVCSPCRDKLATGAGGKCHVCGVALADGDGGYRRCYAMEHLVESIRVPCPHAAHGCAAAPAYHGLDAHRRACAHAPCRCPGEACGHTASTHALLDHFSVAHGWPCTTNVRAGETSSIRLHDGFNFLRVVDAATQHLIMLNMRQEPFGRAISVLHIHPHAHATEDTTTAMRCELMFYNGGGSLYRRHHQRSEFDVGCSDLSGGLPDPRDCFQFVVPECVIGDDNKAGIEIKTRIITVS